MNYKYNELDGGINKQQASSIQEKKLIFLIPMLIEGGWTCALTSRKIFALLKSSDLIQSPYKPVREAVAHLLFFIVRSSFVSSSQLTLPKEVQEFLSSQVLVI